jgi:voltage-gated potassium channel
MHSSRSHIEALIASFFAMILAGTVVYHYLEGWSWVDSAYFSAVTIATVGYGDHVPVTAAGKLFTIPFIFGGVTVFLMLANAISHTYHDYHIKKNNY